MHSKTHHCLNLRLGTHNMVKMRRQKQQTCAPKPHRQRDAFQNAQSKICIPKRNIGIQKYFIHQTKLLDNKVSVQEKRLIVTQYSNKRAYGVYQHGYNDLRRSNGMLQCGNDMLPVEDLFIM